MRLGFIGTGTITQAVVTGLLRFGVTFDHISLSPRNAETAAGLAALDGRVRACANNQEVLETSDIFCLAAVPQITTDVSSTLRFDSRHHLTTYFPRIPFTYVPPLDH